MKLKRILTMVLACIMALNLFAAFAEGIDANVPETLTYQGGVVARRFPSDAAMIGLDTQLELGYALTVDPYIILNEKTVWKVIISGGTEPYECSALLAYQNDLSLDPFKDGWRVKDRFDVEGGRFEYTFTGAGRYFWQFDVSDADGQSITFQTRIYETYTVEDEADATTVAGKVNSIIASEITAGMSDYARAKALHDWLIYNANYDYTYTNYDAAGVLLKGSGVCDSYARAYLMLMTAAGIDCMIVSGTAGSGADSSAWGNHAWNLVKLGGSWYHVDCTWDDPNEGGGYERHTYFCVDDATMKKDHRWNTPDDLFDSDGMLVPMANGGEYQGAEAATKDYDFTFATFDEFGANLEAEIAVGNFRQKTVGMFTGSNDNFWAEFQVWVGVKSQELANRRLITGCSYGYSTLNGTIYAYVRFIWVNPDDYLRIDAEKLFVNAGSEEIIIPSEYVADSGNFECTSSNTAVADAEVSVSADGMYITVSAHAAGKATITVTSVDGISDSIEVTVLEAYSPEFDLTMSEGDDSLTLNWTLIPGITEYRVMHGNEDEVACLAIVGADEYVVDNANLTANALNELYVVAARVVNGNDAMTYSSEKMEYVVLSFASALPENIVTIDSEAFAGDAALESLYIPDGAKTIGEGAFEECDALVAVRVPGSVESIGDGAFDDSALRFVQTEKGSWADGWFAQNMPDVMVKYE